MVEATRLREQRPRAGRAGVETVEMRDLWSLQLLAALILAVVEVEVDILEIQHKRAVQAWSSLKFRQM